MAQEQIQASLVTGAVKANQVVTQPPGNCFLEALQHHPVEATEQGTSWSLLLQAAAVVAAAEFGQLAASEINPDRVELVESSICQQSLGIQRPHRYDQFQGLEHAFGGPIARNGVHRDCCSVWLAEASQGLASQ